MVLSSPSLLDLKTMALKHAASASIHSAVVCCLRSTSYGSCKGSFTNSVLMWRAMLWQAW